MQTRLGPWLAGFAFVGLVLVGVQFLVHKIEKESKPAAKIETVDRSAALQFLVTAPTPIMEIRGFPRGLPPCNSWSRGRLVRIFPGPVMLCTAGNGWIPVIDHRPENERNWIWIEAIEMIPHVPPK